MILNKYIYDIKGLLRNHNIVDDDLLSDRQVEFWIVSQRATWIKRRDKAFIAKDHSLMQTVTFPVISIDRSFNNVDIPVNYRILRSEEQLPKTINFESWDGYISVGPVDMAARRFNHKEYEEAINSGWGRFNRSQIFTFSHDSYIYFISQSHDDYWKLLSQAAAIGIFEDPREVSEFTHIDGQPCWSADMEYPISLDLWAYMKDEIRKGNVEELTKIPVDQANDDNQSKADMP